MEDEAIKKRKRIKKLRDSIASIYNQFYAWKALQNKAYNKTYKKQKYFWIATLNALQFNFLMELAKLFEKNKEHKSYTVLSFDLLLDNIEDEDFKNEIYKKIKNKEKSIKNLLGWRNKKLAHNDEDYMIEPDKILENFPLKYQEIESLLELIQEIFSDIVSKYKGKSIKESFDWVLKEESEKNTEYIVELIEEGRKKKEADFNKKINKEKEKLKHNKK